MCSPVTPDGIFLASASKDGQPMLRNGETGDWVGTFQGHKGAVWSCVLNDAAVIAATASADFTARVWNATTGDELHQFQVGAVGFMSVDRALGCSTSGVNLINSTCGSSSSGLKPCLEQRLPAFLTALPAPATAPPRTLLQHKHIARSVSFARGDTSWQLCTGGAEKLLRIFDLQRPEAPPTGGL
jgi:WD40 repeat protein